MALISLLTGQKFQANLNLRLDIEGRNPVDAMLIQGLENIRCLDDQGRVLPTPKVALPAEWIRPGSGIAMKKQEVIGFQKETDSKSLQTLEADLMVVNGTVRTLTFAQRELRPGASQSSGQVSATLHSIKKTNDTYQVSITCVSSALTPLTLPNVPAESVSWLWGGTPQIEFIGTNGVHYRNNGEEMRTSLGTSDLTFSFPSLPKGVHPRTIILHVVEQRGDNFRIPVKFTDIPLAGAS